MTDGPRPGALRGIGPLTVDNLIGRVEMNKHMWAIKNKSTGRLYGETQEDWPLLHRTREHAELDVGPGEQAVPVRITIEILQDG